MSVKAWDSHVAIGVAARKQAMNTSSLPFVHKHVALMPDAHVGLGATVGSVVATKGAIIPAAVGVDIGCGMTAVRLDLDAGQLPDSLATVRSLIESAVPHGRTDGGGANDKGSHLVLPHDVVDAFRPLVNHYASITDRWPELDHPRALRQLGSLGTGNHFIEVCLDETGQVWVMLHSGSRGLGNRIGTKFIRRAKREMERWFIQLPDADLAYLPEGSDDYAGYIECVGFAQRYAKVNREVMMMRVLNALRVALWPRQIRPTGVVVDCHHNYVSEERHYGATVNVTRKGAVSARLGELGIIPGSMGDRSYIVEGLGNRESFHSCSHGAGRKGSRRWARETFTVEDHAERTKGVECRKDESVLDETPQAYKDIDAVMQSQADLVRPIHTLKQIVCVKG